MRLPENHLALHKAIGLGDGQGEGVPVTYHQLVAAVNRLAEFIIAAGEADKPDLLAGKLNEQEALAAALASAKQRWPELETLIQAVAGLERILLRESEAMA